MRSLYEYRSLITEAVRGVPVELHPCSLDVRIYTAAGRLLPSAFDPLLGPAQPILATLSDCSLYLPTTKQHLYNACLPILPPPRVAPLPKKQRRKQANMVTGNFVTSQLAMTFACDLPKQFSVAVEQAMQSRKRDRYDLCVCDPNLNVVLESDNRRIDQIALKAVKRLPEILADKRASVYAVVIYDTVVDSDTVSRIASATNAAESILLPLLRALNYQGLLLLCQVMPSDPAMTSPVYMYRARSPRIHATRGLLLPYHWLEQHFCGPLR
jgi:hypothetical protein